MNQVDKAFQQVFSDYAHDRCTFNEALLRARADGIAEGERRALDQWHKSLERLWEATHG